MPSHRGRKPIHAPGIAQAAKRVRCDAQAGEAIDMLLGGCDLASIHYGDGHPSAAGVLLDAHEALQVQHGRACMNAWL
jgi:hypothetical protein